ncbi:MAG: hypothetical protein JSU81_02815 [Candidatus Coatesbacteria bacterium]|nr:MAG: hypothetical protein JSU81_02815 [Candidatus Coatesbacteria bacterium]
MRIALIACAVAAAACGGRAGPPEAASAETVAAGETPEYRTAADVRYYVDPVGYTDACLPGEALEMSFRCYNAGERDLAAPEVYGASRITLATASGDVLEPPTQPLGVYDGPAVIPPGGTFSSTVDVAALFGGPPLGEYVVQWEVDGGVVRHPLSVREGADYYLYRLANDLCHNAWGLHCYGEHGFMTSGLGREALAAEVDLVHGLVELLDDEREAFIEGSEDATIADYYGWRVCDFAAILLVESEGLQGKEKLRSPSPAARDQIIEELKFY